MSSLQSEAKDISWNYCECNRSANPLTKFSVFESKNSVRLQSQYQRQILAKKCIAQNHRRHNSKTQATKVFEFFLALKLDYLNTAPELCLPE